MARLGRAFPARVVVQRPHAQVPGGPQALAPATAAIHLTPQAFSWSAGAVTLSPATKNLVLVTGAVTWGAPSLSIIPAAALGAVRGATGASPQNHLIFARNTGRWWFFTYVGRADTGTATSGSQAALNDLSKSWTPGQWLGYACIITAGTGAGQSFTIGNNTATSLPVVDNGATGSWLKTALDSTSQYEIVENRIRAYVSSGSDLSTATWSEATGSASPTDGDGSSLGEGINLAGGSNNPGGFAEYPTDGRLLALGYGSVAGVDVVHLLMQQDSHYIHLTLRARITGPTTIAWDAKLPTTGNKWNDTAPGIEDAPEFPQALSIGFHPTTAKWWWLNEENFTGISGYASGVADNGTANQDPVWSGNNGGLKPTGFDSTLTSTGAPWNSAVVPLALGFVLGVYCNGTETTSTPSAGNTHQTGLRFVESASSSQWPTAAAAGAAVPNLSAASNSPNDWGICKVSDTDIHVVRRNSATTLEHIRYSGHGGSWGSVVTLPTTGLTGHLATSGVALVSDGTNVWCLVIDTDSNHSIRYIKWNGTSWAASWSTLTTGSEPKSFITAAINADGSQIAVAWTANSTAPYAVNYAALNPNAPASQILAPSTVGLVLAAVPPTLADVASLAPASKAMALSPVAPSWAVGGVNLAPATRSLTFGSVTFTWSNTSQPQTYSPATAHLTLAAVATTWSAGTATLKPNADSLTLGSVAFTWFVGQSFTPATPTLTLSAVSPRWSHPAVLSPSTRAITLATQAPHWAPGGITLSPASRSLNLASVAFFWVAGILASPVPGPTRSSGQISTNVSGGSSTPTSVSGTGPTGVR